MAHRTNYRNAINSSDVTIKKGKENNTARRSPAKVSKQVFMTEKIAPVSHNPVHQPHARFNWVSKIAPLRFPTRKPIPIPISFPDFRRRQFFSLSALLCVESQTQKTEISTNSSPEHKSSMQGPQQ